MRTVSSLPGVALSLALLLAHPAAAEPLALSARAVPLHAEDPERARVGALVYRGGLELTASDARFGGLSGLLVSEDGGRMTAVGDRGHWVTARLLYDAAGRLSGVAGAEIGELHGPGGAHLRGKRDRDSESLTRFPDGAIVVGFERNHRLWRYPAGVGPLAGQPVPLSAPSALEALRSNSGIEALATLSDGALFALAEGRKEATESPAYLRRDGAWAELGYRRHGGFRPSGAARLPGGDLLVIERSFNIIDGVAVRVRRIAAQTIVPGARLDGTAIAVLSLPLTVDNLEGVAARRSAAGETLIYLVSDDNFNPLQRTLLLMFALGE
jgi:hypothetical protein